jgi:integrase
MASIKLTQAVVDALSAGTAAYITYDAALPGFGVRTNPSGRKVWLIEYRPNGGGRSVRKRRYTFGTTATLSVADARTKSKRLLGGVHNDQDPMSERAEQRAALTISQLEEKFLRLEGPTWKPRTRDLFAFYFRKFIIPELGSKRARDVSHADIVRLHRKVGERAQPTANRIVSVLRLLFNWAERAKDVPAGYNPARGVKRFKEQGKERYLTSGELARLGETLREAETIGIEWQVDEDKPTAKHLAKKENRREVLSPFATGAIRLLLFTGCRKSEILTLRWDHVDLERGTFLLADAKAGKRHVLLSAPALAVLATLYRIRIGSYVIAGDDPEHPRADLNRPWRAIVTRAGLTGVRLHDLRHSFASVGAGGSLGLPIIGKLLGHLHPATTMRYAHLADDPLRRASESIGNTIAAAMNEPPMVPSAEIVPLRRTRARPFEPRSAKR